MITLSESGAAQSFVANAPPAAVLRPLAAPVIDAVAHSEMEREIERLPDHALLDSAGDLHVYLSPAAPISITLREIGRLREIAFRAAGEGTGRGVDLDEFDRTYLHLFVWNAARSEVVAGYRLQTVDGVNHLYTRTLFQFDDRFFATMGPAVELGRSFVRVEYQKGFAPLLLLWKGIGKFIAAHPRYKTLFGPVSISNQYEAISRELMIAYLERHASIAEWTNLVRALHAPARRATNFECRDLDELSDTIRHLEPAQPGIPVLLRQYLKLGGKLLSFSVDPDFSNALDGLIVVDLTRTEPRLLERYLGKAEARAFLNHHKETHHA
jgi:putative hemolysin